MLNPNEIKEISEEFSHYEQKSAVCIEALRIVQRSRRWISDDSVRDIADFLEMTPDEVDGVATFYNLVFREPVGKHVIFVCDSVSCWVMGCEKLKRHLNTRLGIKIGETTADGLFTVLPSACLGACDKAPVILVDGELATHLKTSNVDELLNKLRTQEESLAHE